MVSPGIAMQTTFNYTFSLSLSKRSVLLNCFNYIKDMKAGNCLQLNLDKTEILIFAPDGVVPNPMEKFGCSIVSGKFTFHEIGFSAEDLESSPTCEMLGPLLFSPAERYCSNQAHQVFISYCLDYCNSVFTDLSKTSLFSHQIQNPTKGYFNPVQSLAQSGTWLHKIATGNIIPVGIWGPLNRVYWLLLAVGTVHFVSLMFLCCLLFLAGCLLFWCSVTYFSCCCCSLFLC